MPAPPLTRLRTEDGQAAAPAAPTPIELPDELWVKILMAVQMHDPCAQLTKWCDTEKKWAIWCRDGTLYEAANRQLGWYGRFEGLKAVQAHVKGMAGIPIWTPPPTAKLYFQEVCKALHRARGVGSDPPWLLEKRYLERPYWPVIAERVLHVYPSAVLMLPWNVPGYADLVLAAVRRDFTLFKELPQTLSNYGEVFKVAVNGGNEPGRGRLLQYVPHRRDDYSELAKLAVQKGGRALQYVPWGADDYGEIAKLAVQQDGGAIRFVPVERRDFFELARLAVQQNGEALYHIDSDYAHYGELAMLAVARTPSLLNGIASTRADFSEIAMIAVGRDGMVLRHVDGATPNYVAICRAAVATNGRALRHVRRRSVDEDAFYEMAQVAMKQNGMALNDLDNMEDDLGNPFDHESDAFSALTL